ncbi:MAG: YciI family protein [Actinomycetota bacterium]|nr:YciI family protein [Actinomycetota bacterium]
MTKFLLLIYGDERTWAEASDDWQAHNAAGHVAFQAEAGPRVLAGGELQPAAQAVSLRPDDRGRPVATDGPFVETKEVIGGYYLVEADDLEAATALAARIPEASTPSSGVEIRRLEE